MNLVEILLKIIVHLEGKVPKETMADVVREVAQDFQNRASDLHHKRKLHAIKFLRENCTIEDFQEPTPVHPCPVLYLLNAKKLVEGIMDILEG